MAKRSPMQHAKNLVRSVRRSRLCWLSLAVWLLALVAASPAANRRWLAAGSGTFSVASNWSGGVVPGPGDVAQFGTTGPPPSFQTPYTVSFSANATNQALHIEDDLVIFDLNGHLYTVTAASGILIGNQAGGMSGFLSIIDGTVGSATNIDVGAAANQNGSLNVGAGGLISGSPTLTIGKLGNGFLTVQSGGDISSTGATTIGASSGITGTATITGAGSTFFTDTLNVGTTGNGTVNVTAGGFLQNNSTATVGSGNLFSGVGTGTVNVTGTGSWWNVLNTLTIGDGDGSVGQVNINSGGTVTGFSNVLGAFGGSVSSSGEVNVDGAGSTWDNQGTMTVGELGFGELNITNQGIVKNTGGFIGRSSLGVLEGTGTVNVSGANSEWINSSDLTVGDAGQGTLNVTDGGFVSSVEGDIGNQPGSSGTVAVRGAGSRWLTTSVNSLNVGSFGTGTLHILDGGAVENAQSGAYIGRHTGSVGTVTVEGPGSTWTLHPQNALSVGSFGSGTLEILNGGTVSNDTGFIGRDSAAESTVTVDGNGSMWINSGDLFVGSFSGGSSVLNITGGGAVSSLEGFINSESGPAAAVTVDGPGSRWTNSGQLAVGAAPISDAGAGTLTISVGGAVSNTDGTIGADSGTTGAVAVTGDSSTWTNSGFLTVGLSGTGTLDITGGGHVNSAGAVIGNEMGSAGAVTVDGPGSTWSNTGLLFVSGFGGGAGTLTVSNGGVVSVTDLLQVRPAGTLQGNGQIIGNVSNLGTTGPGTSPGALNVTGDFTQGASGKLKIELAGTIPGTQYDQLLVSGALALAGTLEVSLIGGFQPTSGMSFDILDFGSIGGTFDTITLPTLSSGLTWNISQLYISGVISVGLPGDFNNDANFDAADYVAWRKADGSQAGYDNWRQNFGESAGGGARADANAAAPEPASLVMLERFSN